MLNITKIEPKFFTNYIKKYKPKKYEECEDIRRNLRVEFIREQNRQCVYCECLINIDNSHNDHIKPRDKEPNLECDYNNLVASCEHQNRCGKFKENKIFRDDYIHPVFDNPEEYFEYIGGKIFPKKDLNEIDKQRAKDTRDYLNLNSDELVKIRQQIERDLEYCSDLDLNVLIDSFKGFETLIKSVCK